MRKPTEKHPEPALTFGAPPNLANVTVILVERRCREILGRRRGR